MYKIKYPIASTNKIKIEFYKGKAFIASNASSESKPSLLAIVGKVAILIPAYGNKENKYNIHGVVRILGTKKIA